MCLGWIFFRAVGFPDALTTLRSFTLFHSPGTQAIGRSLAWIFPVLAVVHWRASRGHFSGWWRGLPDWAFAAVYGVLTAVAVTCVPVDAAPFIYFQF